MASVKPDSSLVKEQLAALQEYLRAWGPELFMQMMFWVLTKLEESFPGAERTKIVPFRLNREQHSLLRNLARNNLLLKARQIGGTTFFMLCRGLLNVITKPGTNALLISQNGKYAQEHFQIARRAYNLIGAENPHDKDSNDFCISLKQNLLHTEYSNRRELVFDQLDSKFQIESAENEEAGQGLTLHHLICSEYSRWEGNPAATLSNARGGLEQINGTLDIECTANGAAGDFYAQFLLAMSDPDHAPAKAHFFEWFWHDEYKLPLDAQEAKELEEDLSSDERKLIERIRFELKDISWHEGICKIGFRRQAQKEQRGNFDEKYPETWQTAFLLGGEGFFDRPILVARKMELTGFKPFQLVSRGEGQIFHQRIPGRRYLIGADPRSGKLIDVEKTDFAAAVVLDLDTGEEYAALRARLSPEQLAWDLADLGRYFNNAVIAVERTGDGGTCILTLVNECRYGAIYKHKDWWKRERKVIEIEGFPTTTKTRPVALSFVNRFILDHPELIWDMNFIDEALVFVRDEKGIPKAAPQAHDDTVSARWVAHASRMALLGYWDPQSDFNPGYVSASMLTAASSLPS